MTQYAILIKWSEDTDPWELENTEEYLATKGIIKQLHGYYVSNHSDVVKVILAFQDRQEFFGKYAKDAKLLRITDVNDLTRLYG